jgi:hypothetical protein
VEILKAENRSLEELAQLSRLPLEWVRETMAMQFDDRPSINFDVPSAPQDQFNLSMDELTPVINR